MKAEELIEELRLRAEELRDDRVAIEDRLDIAEQLDGVADTLENMLRIGLTR